MRIVMIVIVVMTIMMIVIIIVTIVIMMIVMIINNDNDTCQREGIEATFTKLTDHWCQLTCAHLGGKKLNYLLS